jgi:hypothetical protein
MTQNEIFDKYLKGELTFDMKGHYISWLDERFRDYIQHTREHAAGSNDNGWSVFEGKTIAETNAQMRDCYQKELDMIIEEGGHTRFGGLDNQCDHCNKRLRWSLRGNKLVFDITWGKSTDWKWVPSEDCAYARPKPLYGKIKVDSKLIFANFFRSIPDSPEEDKYTGNWSLCNTIGQENITKYKSERNVAFGQMSNMSVAILVSPDKDHIVIANPYWDEAWDDDEKELMDSFPYKNYRKAGKISCAVWRWEATPVKTLGAKVLKEMRNEDYPQDIYGITVEHGDWEVIHYYETNTCPHPSVYSELKLIKH